MLLKSNSKKKPNTKLVGVLFPEGQHSFLALYTVAKSITKTTIVLDELKDWESTVKMCGDTEDELMKEVILKARNSWNAAKVKDPEKTLWDFKRELKTELRIKGVSETHISLIIKGF